MTREVSSTAELDVLLLTLRERLEALQLLGVGGALHLKLEVCNHEVNAMNRSTTRTLDSPGEGDDLRLVNFALLLLQVGDIGQLVAGRR